jgi:hypothetical protein
MDELMGTGAVVAGRGTVEPPNRRAGGEATTTTHLVPTVLGEGRRLFEGLGVNPHDLGLLRVVQNADVTHLRYRVLS